MMIYVDIPTESCFTDDEGAYKNVARFRTMKEAVAYLRKHLGENCVTDDGFVKLTMGVDLPVESEVDHV